MRKAVSIDKLAIGEILSQDIYDGDNHLLLRKGTVLLEALVEALRQRELYEVYVRAEGGTLLAADTLEETANQGRKPSEPMAGDETALYHRFTTLYSRLVFEMRRARLRGQYNKVLPAVIPEQAARMVKLAAELDDRQTVAFYLQAKQHYPSNRFEYHAVNVCFLAAVLGIWRGDSEEENLELALCGLLHDIGDTQIPVSIYEKNSRLTESEWNVVKTHPLLGARLASKNRWATKAIVNGILWHHEKLDGSGYPGGLENEAIPLYSRIVATACTFDAMTAERPYREAMSLFQALELLKRLSFGQLDSRFTRLLYEKIMLYFQGREVELTSGERGTIIGLEVHPGGRRLLVKGEQECYDFYRQETPAIRHLIG